MPDKVVEEVDSMSGVGALILDKGRAEGKIVGRIESLYYDSDCTIEEIAEKTKMTEKEIKNILSLSDEEP